MTKTTVELISELSEKLAYDKDSGLFTWRLNGGSRARVGNVAGSINADGYRLIRIGKKDFYAHRIAWLFEYGFLPKIIDHIDGNPGNNAILNLRAADKSSNGANRGKQANNTSGFKGVRKRHRKWIAQIQIAGSNIYIGIYDTPIEASDAYVKKSFELFGEFARS